MSEHEFLICGVQDCKAGIADRVMHPFTAVDGTHTCAGIVNEIQPSSISTMVAR